ncbi:hypothetical protein [Pantoea cypripedii]|uniref:Uncharacterized protein n=1 Tax=Pantoea cypripedii TaxID=55209 RepID=A0A6B9GG63_PANCY|nr:hypothetical protein [Pantoea cypripedii]QGY32196.1 hypothetical protein CUN67_24700 [Pantoea cypripedii]
MMWDADENGLIGSWHELDPGAAMRLDIGGITVDIHRRNLGWEVLVKLTDVPFSFSLLGLVERDFPNYLLLLLREQCYLHRYYVELTSHILNDLHEVTTRLKEWPRAE